MPASLRIRIPTKRLETHYRCVNGGFVLNFAAGEPKEVAVNAS